ncbi:prephenate dehydrogenase/arogenate dehydrogenase family protein [Tessaracoccus sp. OH4464_COT-324]|uniref:prephenate dehydrogenase/arogenate dehydrogenase family protein n=1 Tax=Tessaracoccus sp. OH4464_COT-324 TaxID=2491059 RepID=UPI000F6366E2|nr:prephenate dehydrogenase/arogenate dehydrogenase family protein [Tessaracoccus sp. OH4464_COT-324]
MALTSAGCDVVLSDAVGAHAVVAAGLGAGRVGLPGGDEVDLVVVATPPDAIAPVVVDSLNRYPVAVVTDVGSVKAPIMRRVGELAGELAARYVPSHPMAGSQFTGPLTASGQLFVDRTWVITPAPGNSPESVARVVESAELAGAHVLVMDAERHDEAVAQVSHVPHLMSILTASHLRAVPGEHLRLAGQGIRDVTRIAGSDPRLWRQIITANARAIRAELAEVADDLRYLIEVLDQPERLEGFLGLGRDGANALLVKHGAEPLDVWQVIVEIPDEPRALARLFTDIGDAGFNVEDFELQHDPAREVGYLTIVVGREVAEQFRETLEVRGWVTASAMRKG